MRNSVSKWCYTIAFALWIIPPVVVAENPNCDRIVSLAPSLTESAFALELGSKIVGVSEFDKYPAQVGALPKIGALLNPNIEAILSLSPTLVIGLKEQEETLSRLSKLGIQTDTLDQRTLQMIIDSIGQLGALCGVSQHAAALQENLRAELNAFQKKPRVIAAPVRTLVLIGNSGGETLSNLFVSGKDGFYDELLGAVGGQNIFSDLTSGMSALNFESLLAMNPNLIILISGTGQEIHFDKAKFMAEWRKFPALDAVKKNRIYVFDQDFASIPGPRFVKLLPLFWQAVQGEFHE